LAVALARWFGALGAITAMMLSCAIPVADAEDPPAYAALEPVIIASNEDFTAENGVTGGKGTQADPYIIEKWSVNASLANGSAGGFTISHTDAHFVIRDVVVYDGGDLYCGIFLSNVMNCRIERVVLTDNYEGVTVNSTSDLWISDSEIQGNVFSGIYCIASEGVHVEGSEVGNSTYGIYLSICADTLLVGNNVNSGDKAVLVNESERVTVQGNNISDSEYGIYFDSASDCAVIGNSITRNSCGVHISPGCTDIVIEDNTFSENDISVSGTSEEGDGVDLVLAVVVMAAVVVALIVLALALRKRAGP
jgi:parallel beta-helix repeat protein